MKLLQAIAVAAAGNFEVNLGAIDPATIKGIRLRNESPFDITVPLPNSGSKSIGSWFIDTFPATGLGVTLPLSAVLNGSTVGAPTSNIIIEVATENDGPDLAHVFPGSYPQPMPRAIQITAGAVTINGTPAVTISSGTVNAVVTGTVSIGNVPAVTISGSVTIASISSGSITFTNSQIAVLNVGGTQLQTQQPMVALGTLISNAPGSFSANYAIPSGTHSMVIFISYDGVGLHIPNAITVTGNQSGTTYLRINPNGIYQTIAASNDNAMGYMAYFQVDSADDTTINVLITASGASQGVRTAIALDPQVVEVRNTFFRPLITQAQLQPWHAPNKQSAPFATAIASGAVLTIVAASGLQCIWIFSCTVGYDAAPAGALPTSLQDAAGANTYHWFSGATVAPPSFDGGGMRTPQNGSLALHNFSTGAVTPRGSVTYSQALQDGQYP